MAKLTRVTGKVFGSQASPTGDVDNGAYIGQFGSAQAGTYVGTDDVAMIQNLPAWEQGWIGACVEEDQLPPLPERTGVDKVLSYQECYILQQGMPEWDSATTYYKDNFCSYNGIIYKSLTDINLNNQPDTSVANWEVYGKISQYTKFAINKGNNPLLYTNNAPLYWKRNVTLVGTLTVTDNTIISGFNTTSAFSLPNDFYPSTGTWESVSKIKITSFTYPMTIMDDAVIGGFNGISLKVATDGRIQAFASSTGASYNIINGLLSTNTLSLNTWYYVKYSFTGSAYRVDVSTTGAFSGEETNFIYVSSSTPINYMPFMFGVDSNNQYPFAGEMDLKGFYIKLNNTIWWEGIIQGTSLDYDWMESTGTDVKFNVDNTNTLTYTNIMGETRTVTALSPIDVSAENDGTYKVALPQTGNQPYLFDGNVFITEDIPVNATIIGNPIINKGIVSGFLNGGTSETSTYVSAKNIPTSYSTFELISCLSTTTINVIQNLLDYGVANTRSIALILQNDNTLQLYVSSDGSSWDIVNGTKSTLTLSANTQYFIKTSFTGTQYLVDVSTTGEFTGEETNYITINNSTSPYKATFIDFGLFAGTPPASPFLGSIDFTKTLLKLDNQLVWTGQGNIGDIWLNPQEPYTAKQYDGADWQDFNDVLLLDSSVTVSSGVISDLEQPKYNNPHITPNKSYISGLGMPSNKYIDLTLGASGSEYVAPANGWFFSAGYYNSALQFNKRVQDSNMDEYSVTTNGGVQGVVGASILLPVKKGDIVYFVYTSTVTLFRFIYAEGEV